MAPRAGTEPHVRSSYGVAADFDEAHKKDEGMENFIPGTCVERIVSSSSSSHDQKLLPFSSVGQRIIMAALWSNRMAFAAVALFYLPQRFKLMDAPFMGCAALHNR